MFKLLVPIALLVLEPFVIVKGSVQDSEGAATPGTHVIYRRDQSGEFISNHLEDHGKSEGTALTAKDGIYRIKVHPGIYDICMMSNAFTPQCYKVEIKSSRRRLPDFHLKADTIVSNTLADRFEN